MKKWIGGIAIVTTSIFLPVQRASAQQFEIQQLLLNVEKLTQFKEILQQMYDYYKTIEGGYNKVRDIASGNFKLHEVFLDGLLAVSPEVKKYKKVADIIQVQLLLVKEYKTAFAMFKSCNMFNKDELQYLEDVYNDLINESLKNLDALLTILTAGKLRMSDSERLQAIDAIYKDMENKLDFLRVFNKNNHILALQRLKEKGEIEGMKALHDLK